jgi:hypothetical protein
VANQVKPPVFFPGRDVEAGETRAQEVGALFLEGRNGECGHSWNPGFNGLFFKQHANDFTQYKDGAEYKDNFDTFHTTQ